MIKLDNALLVELGLGGLPLSHRRALLQIIYQEIEMRVGTRLTSAMTDVQLSRFETFIRANDEAAALAFLETDFPGYRDVVAAEFALLLAEINAHLRDIQALSWAYIDIPIELPPHKSPWDRQQETVDSQSPAV